MNDILQVKYILNYLFLDLNIMEFPRKIGKTVAMSSSDESTSSIFLGYHNLILQDPRINLKLPKFLLIGIFGDYLKITRLYPCIAI